MKSIVRLGMGSYFQLAKAIGSPIFLKTNSTLNEAVNNSRVIPHQPAIPTAGMELADDYNYQTDSNDARLQYLAIGIGGHYSTVNATHSISKMVPQPHSARDTGVFKMIPFVVKPLTADLTVDDRKKYRLRKVVEIGGVLYAAYFLRHMDLSTAAISQNIVKKIDGVKTSVPYEPTINDLIPQAPEINGQNDGSYLQTLIAVDITFNSVEAQWMREMAALWFGDEDLAIVSEFALCSGVDKPITKRFPQTGAQTAIPVSSSLTEAVGVTMTVIESTFKPLTFTNGSASERIWIGSEDPLYGQAATTG